MEIDPQERQRLIDEAIKGRDNVIRYNLHSSTDWKFIHEVDGLKYYTHQTTSPHEIHGQVSGMIFKPPLFILHHFAVWRYRSKYERNYQQITKFPLEETTQHQIHLVHGVLRPALFIIKRDHVAAEYIGKIQYEGSEYHIASYKNVQTSLIPLYKDYDRVETSIGITIEPRNEGRYSFVKYTILTKLDRISPNFCGKVQGMLKADVVCHTLSLVPSFKQAWETDDDDDDNNNNNNGDNDNGPPKLVLSELKERLSSRDCEDLPRNLEKYNRYSDWSWEQVGSFDDVQLSVLLDPKSINGEFDLAWKMTFTSTLLHPIAQLLSYELTFSRLLWDPCTTSVQILFEDNPFQVLLVKGGGWNSETGCIPFQYVCRTYAVAGENYDLLYEEHDNGDVFLFKFAATADDFTVTSVDVIFLAKATNWEFKLNAKQYTDIISLTLTDLFVNAVVEFRNVLVSGVSFSVTIKNQNRARRPRTPRQRPRKPQKESSLEKLKKHSRTADQLKVHGNFAATIRRRTFRILPPPIVFQPSPRHSIDLDFSKIDLSQQFSISILPDELLMEIFSLLGLADLCKCAQVCAMWKKISEDHVLWAFEPESLFTSTTKGEEWILYFTSSKNIYSTHDADSVLAGDPPPSLSSSSSSSSSSSPSFSINGIINPPPQTHGVVNNPYSAAYNHVYNTFANQNNNYPHNSSHPVLLGNSLNTFNRFNGNYSSMGGSLGTFGKNSFNHYSQFHNNNVNNFNNNTNNNNLLPGNNTNNLFINNFGDKDNNNNNTTNGDNNSILDNNNILYAINKLQQFVDKNEDETMEESELSHITVPQILEERPTGEKGEREKGEVDVDTLNPNIYSISINDAPAETIHVERARKRFASVWTKELGGGMVELQNAKNSAHNSLHNSGHSSLHSSGHNSAQNTTYNTTVNSTHSSENSSETNSNTNSNNNSNTNSNNNSEANSALTSANTSFTNFFELSVPSVHEFVRKTVRNFRPRRIAYQEMPKNTKRQSQAYARSLDNWASGKYKRQCEKQGPSPVLCVRIDENDNNAYCGYANGLLNVFEPDGNLSRFRMMNQPITDVMPGPDGLRVALANGSIQRLNAIDLSSHSLPLSLLPHLPADQNIPVVFGRSHSVVATWEEDSSIVDLFNTSEMKRQQFSHEEGTVNCVEVGNSRMAVGMDDGSVGLWDLNDSSSPLLTFRSHGTGVSCLMMSPSPSERVVTSGSKDGCVMVWDERAGPYYVKRFRSKNEIYSIETKEYKLIVGMNNGNVAYWDPRYLFRPLHSWHLHEKGAPIVGLKCYAKETHMLCGTADGFVGIYDFS